MRTPADKTVVLTYNSHPVAELTRRWTMQLTFPAGAGPETRLPMTFVDGAGHPVKAGTFEFAGRTISVSDGRAEISYADFVRGKHETAIWMHGAEGDPVPGVLTFI